MPDALNILRVSSAPSVTHLYGQLMALAATLFQQIGFQLSVGFGAQHRQRGAYFDLIWAPLSDVQCLHRVCRVMLAGGEDGGEAAQDAVLVERFVDAHRASDRKVVWYASFGDDFAPPPGQRELVRPVPLSTVLPPHREVALGEDPIFFVRPLVEYLDASNDGVLHALHAGRIPRAWRSYLVPIWPRTAACFHLRFPLGALLDGADAALAGLSLRMTYLGVDWNRHGGDWEELNREGMPTRLLANGVVVHDYMESPAITRSYDFALPAAALEGAPDELVLAVEAKYPDKVTFRHSTLPITELWILAHA